MRKKAICVITAVIILLSCAGCGEQAEPADRSFFALDTYITMQAVGQDAEQVLDAAEESIRELEQKWSVTNTGSEIYAINQSDGNPTSISEGMGMERAIEYWHKHGGFEMLFVTEDGDICMTEGWRRSVPIRSVFTWDIYLTRDCPSSVCPIVW